MHPRRALMISLAASVVMATAMIPLAGIFGTERLPAMSIGWNLCFIVSVLALAASLSFAGEVNDRGQHPRKRSWLVGLLSGFGCMLMLYLVEHLMPLIRDLPPELLLLYPASLACGACAIYRKRMKQGDLI